MLFNRSAYLAGGCVYSPRLPATREDGVIFQSHRLQIHEWLSIALVIGLLLCLLLAARYSDRRAALQAEAHLSKAPRKVEVLVKGAVEHAGVYTVTSGIVVKDLLLLAGVTEKADLRRIKLDSQISRSRVLHIKEKGIAKAGKAKD